MKAVHINHRMFKLRASLQFKTKRQKLQNNEEKPLRRGPLSPKPLYESYSIWDFVAMFMKSQFRCRHLQSAKIIQSIERGVMVEKTFSSTETYQE